MLASFISEHTVEYYLVPRFQTLLGVGFAHALPFYFWSTREGNLTSRAQDSADPILLCALFPRRPKIDGSEILMTVNEEVLAMSEALIDKGIPCFLGVPLVHSLLELAANFECRWFSFARPLSHLEYLVFPCDARAPDPSLPILPLRNGQELCEAVRSTARSQKWVDTIETLRSVRSGVAGDANRFFYGRGLYGPQYKPVYFLLLA
jgi:hypothetical protein